MIFRKKKDKATKKIDKLATGLIIGGAVAGIIGLGGTKKGRNITEVSYKKSLSIFGKFHCAFGKSILVVLKIFNKK